MKRYFIPFIAFAFLLSACSSFITPENNVWRITNAAPAAISFTVKSPPAKTLQSGESILVEMNSAADISGIDGTKYDYKFSYYVQNKKLYRDFIVTAKTRYEYELSRTDSTTFEYSDTASNPIEWKNLTFSGGKETLTYYTPREFKLYDKKDDAVLNTAVIQIAKTSGGTQKYILDVQQLETKVIPIPHTLGYTYYLQKIYIKPAQ